MLIPKRLSIGLIPLLLVAGCLRHSASGKVLCTPQTLACKEFVTIEGVHIKFDRCAAQLLRGHLNAIIYCTLSNPTNKDLQLLRRDFKIVSLDGMELVPVQLDIYPVKQGRSENYVFSAHTKEERSQQDFKEFIRIGTLAFLHQGSNLTPDTLFTIQWKHHPGTSASQ
jgi:hypothetical protein